MIRSSSIFTALTITVSYTAFAALMALASPAIVAAQVNNSGYTLPLDLATEAAQAAVKSCAASGYPVTATVVDTAGAAQVVLRGDHSTVHTRDSSFRKAYTVVTLGPIFKFETSAAFAEAAQKNPAAVQISTLPNILALAGGVGIVARGEIVAAIGIGGAPGGEKDEICALAGIAAIKDRLPR
jgi:uncharacterized protein GlcG (DUF336 family)